MTDRVEVVYSGRVQGVGFRMTTLEISGRYPVTGTVRNLPDGTVELVAEADAEVLNLFLNDVQDVFRRHISGQRWRRPPATREFLRFTVVA